MKVRSRLLHVPIASAVLLLAATAAAADAGRSDGHDLRARCAGEERRGACLNELIIVADMHEVVAAWGLNAAQWCMPPDVAPERLREVVLDHLRDSATDLREPSTRLIAAAYARAFPCR